MMKELRTAEIRRLYDAFRAVRSYLPPFEELSNKERTQFEKKMLRVEKDLGEIIWERRRQANASICNQCSEIILRTMMDARAVEKESV